MSAVLKGTMMKERVHCDMCATDINWFIHGTVYGVEVICCDRQCMERLTEVWAPRNQSVLLPVTMIIAGTFTMLFPFIMMLF